MQTKWTQPQAYELLKQYNQDAFHLRHGRTVEEVMRCFARELGYGEEELSDCCTIWTLNSIPRSTASKVSS